MKLRSLPTLLLLLTILFSVSGFAEKTAVTGRPITSTEETFARLSEAEPIIYDLGSSLAVLFYYIDGKGDRLFVTTIGPKDPDSSATATQHIVKMDQDGEYTISIDHINTSSESMKLSAHYEGKDLVVAVSKV